MKNLIALVLLSVLVTGASAQTRPAAPQNLPRLVSFHVAAPCECAGCVFDANRLLKKFAGVRKVSLDGAKHRLDVQFSEEKQPVSALSRAFAALDLGEKSELQWPIADPKTDWDAAAKKLLAIPGVATARSDSKNHWLLLTFKPAPAVLLTQLDAATSTSPKP